MSRFGYCEHCQAPLEAEWFIEDEYKIANGSMYRTGRKRRAVDYLICPECFTKSCVDDSFDGSWY